MTTQVYTQPPWGISETLESGLITIKRLTVNPGHRLSLHYHPEKHEIMAVSSGVARITLGHAARDYRSGEYVTVPAQTIHRVSCVGDVPAVIVEASVGPDETVRIADDYGRAG